MRLLEAVASLSYITSEVVTLMPRDEDTGDIITITIAYAGRGKTATERRITAELGKRLEAAIHEWQEWVERSTTPDPNVPF
jgi:hypothetical protein